MSVYPFISVFASFSDEAIGILVCLAGVAGLAWLLWWLRKKWQQRHQFAHRAVGGGGEEDDAAPFAVLGPTGNVGESRV